MELIRILAQSAHWTAISTVVIALICGIGAAALNALRLAGGARFHSVAGHLAAGLFVLFNAAMFGFLRQVPASTVFNIALLVTAGVFLLEMLSGMRGQFSSFIVGLYARKLDVVGFLLYLFLAYMLFFTLVGPGNMPILTILNNDVYMYGVSADFVLNRDRVGGHLGAIDFDTFLKVDVFGAITLLAFSAHVLGLKAIHATMVPMALACAVMASAIRLIGTRLFGLGVISAFFIGLFAIENALFVYSILNYFLSQTLACASFVMFVYIFMSAYTRDQLKIFSLKFIGISAVYLSILTYFYPIAVVPIFVAMLALMFFTLMAETLLRLKPENAGFPAYGRAFALVTIKLVLLAAAILTILMLLGPDQFLNMVNRIALATAADIGWSLDLIRPAILAGILTWPPRLFGYRTLLELIGLLFLIASAYTMLIRSDFAERTKIALALPLSMFVLFCLGYALLAYLYGATYQQWKFAATYVVPFAFSIPLVLFGTTRSVRYQRLRTGLLVAFIVAVILQSHGLTKKWAAIPAPEAYDELSALDSVASVSRILVDIYGFQQLMLASNFIKHKELDFTGSTYYGPPTPVDNRQPGELILRRSMDGCDPGQTELRLTGGFYLTRFADRTLEEGKPALLDAPSHCFAAQGLGAPEQGGRWTVAHKAELRVHVDPALAGKADLSLMVEPFIAPGYRASQRVVATINGEVVSRAELSGSDPSELLLPLGANLSASGQVDIVLDLPDATRPRKQGPADKNVGELGLLLKSIEVKAR